MNRNSGIRIVGWSARDWVKVGPKKLEWGNVDGWRGCMVKGEGIGRV